MIRHGVAAFSSTATDLKTALNLADDQHVRYLSIQPLSTNSSIVYVGARGVTTSAYGVRLEVPVTNIPSAPFIVTDAQRGAGMKMSDFFIISSTTGSVSVLWSPHE